MTRRYYTSVRLSKREIAEAIDEGKKRKFFRERNKNYWQAQHKEAERRKEEADALERERRKLKKQMI